MAVVTRHHQRTAAPVRCLSSHAVCDDAVFMTCSVARRLLAVWPHAVSHLQYRAGTIAFEIQISHTCTVGREKHRNFFSLVVIHVSRNNYRIWQIQKASVQAQNARRKWRSHHAAIACTDSLALSLNLNEPQFTYIYIEEGN